MRVSVGEITEALNEIRAMVADEKTVSGIMLRFRGSLLELCCTTGKKAIIKKVDLADNDIDGIDLVINYESFISVVNSCQPKGSICVEELEFENIAESSVLRFTITKRIKVVKDNEENLLLGGVNTTDIGYKQANDLSKADMKVKVLTRVDYDGLFNIDTYDEYTVKEIKSILSRMIGEKNKVVYISPKNESAFVAYTNFMAVVPVKDKRIALVLPVNTAKAIVNVIAKMEDDTVLKIGSEKQFIRMTDGDTMASMWEMGSVVENHLTVLSRYNSKVYRTFMLDMHREMLFDTLTSILSATGSEKTKLQFNKEEDCTSISFIVPSSNSSVKGGYKVMCEGIIGDIPDVGYEVSIKSIIDMVSECETDYIAFDFDIDEENGIKTLRISEMDTDERMRKTYEYYEEHNMDMCDAIPVNDKIKIKEECFGTKTYTLVK